MKKDNFEKLIQLVTGRELFINTAHEDMLFECEYSIYRVLPITKTRVSFKWKTPKSEDKMLRSFITAFSSRYVEPNPLAYDYKYGGKEYKWEWLTPEEKERCVYHHKSRMYHKEDLLKQVEANFSSPDVCTGLIKYGFYETNYGIGIFCFWLTKGVKDAIDILSEHLTNLSIPFKNEFSDAKWVYRFKIGLSKENHLNIINQLNK